jgi:hypothetical protein
MILNIEAEDEGILLRLFLRDRKKRRNGGGKRSKKKGKKVYNGRDTGKDTLEKRDRKEMKKKRGCRDKRSSLSPVTNEQRELLT